MTLILGDPATSPQLSKPLSRTELTRHQDQPEVRSFRNNGIGVFGKEGRLAGFVEGDVEVTGDSRGANADCAEEFDIADADLLEPGTVMVLGDKGEPHQSHHPYDQRVAGVISGAGDYTGDYK